jgi:hypothetical protein
MPSGMFLKSEGFASTIDAPRPGRTLGRFCAIAGLPYADVGWPVPIETFRAYGHWFQQELVPQVEEDEALVVEREGEAFVVELRSGARATARRVVVATGLTAFAYVPAELRSLPPGLLSHTSDHADFTEFRGRHVAVVGAGQSALETAALLRERGGKPELIVRSPSVQWNPEPASGSSDTSSVEPYLTPLGASRELWAYWNAMRVFWLLPERRRARFVRRVLGPSGAWWLRPRLEHGIPTNTGHALVRAEKGDGGVLIELAGAERRRELRVEHVIAGTGYRIDIEKLAFLGPELRSRIRRLAHARGAPALSRMLEASVPGLYFTGLAAANTFGPAMRFVCGTSFVAPRLAQHLASRASRPSTRRRQH